LTDACDSSVREAVFRKAKETAARAAAGGEVRHMRQDDEDEDG